ncbi:MAG: TolC family protein [Akkermansia sp.]|nr:TolC family protein [Akkermansia sp.]MCD8070155.1 TolC family protein [Akkermansiaceae bacterium]
MRFLPIGCLLLLLAGCSVSKRMERTGKEVVAVYESLPDWERLPVRRITWEQAVSMAMEKNLELRKARGTIKQAKRSARSVYTDMIPGVNLYASMTRALEDLARSPDSNAMSYNINVVFNIPSLTQLPYRIYSSQAELYATEKAYELKQREIVSKIWQHVRTADLDRRLHELDLASFKEEERKTAGELKEQEFREQSIDNWSKLTELLGTQSARWEILPESLPKLDRARYEREAVHLSPLVVTQYAIQLEAARMNKYQILMNYLPQINMSLYSPSLFSSTGGTYGGTFLDSSDTKLTTYASLSLDTKLTYWNQFRTAQDEYEYTKQELRAKLMDRRIQVGKVIKSCREFEEWKSWMKKRMAFEASRPISTAEQMLEKRRRNIDMEREILNQEKRKVEGEAALMIEYGIFSI